MCVSQRIVRLLTQSLILCLCASANGFGQTGGSTGVINGATSPEKIADEVAWRMFFKAIADGPGAPAYSVRATVVRSAGFSDDESLGIISAANEALARIRSMEATVMPMNANMDAKTRMLRSQRDAILREVVSDLLSRLKPAAADRFRDHIQSRVKRGITITP